VRDLSEILADGAGVPPGGRPAPAGTENGEGAGPEREEPECSGVGEGGRTYIRGTDFADFPAAGVLPRAAESPQVLGQLGSAYILAEEAGDLLIIDQHNAHERVIYDRYVEIDRERKWPVKMSLLPLVFELSPVQEIGLEEAGPMLRSSGFRVEPMGGRSYALREYPDVFRPEEALSVVLAAADESKKGAPAPAKDRLLAAMACKSAVKAGEYLPREKMEFLVRELFRSANPGVCPHGRPIVVRIPRSQIERGLRRPVSDPAS
jgi:DNA mismatch repair enzyme (predicted ATPase)